MHHFVVRLSPSASSLGWARGKRGDDSMLENTAPLNRRGLLSSGIRTHSLIFLCPNGGALARLDTVTKEFSSVKHVEGADMQR
jgi:hypothetical protein